MSDGVDITAGTGTKIATDDAGAAGHVQIVKLAVGADADATALPADATAGLKVDLGADNDVAVSSIAAGDNNIGNVDVVTMPNVTLAAGTNTNEVVGDAAHDAAAAGNPLLQGGYASAAAPTDVSADGDVVRAWMLRNGATSVVLTAAGALIPGDAANGLDVDVTRLPALVAGTANIGDVDVLTLPNVTLAAGTNTNEVVGDAAHDAAAAGNPLLVGGYASAAAPTNVSADADVVRAWMLRNGATCVNLTAAGALIPGDASNGLDVDVTRMAALVASSANIGDVDVLTLPAIPAGNNNIGDVDIATIAAGDNNIGNVDVVTMPAVVVSTLPTSTNTLEVVGDAAHDAAAAGNPLLVGGYASAAAPTDVSADADVVRAWMLRNGATCVNLTAAGALIPGDATNGLDVDVTRMSALVASSANIGDVDVLTLPNVTLAAGTNTNEVVGDAAHDAAAAGNPLLVGGYASAAAPTDVSADADVVRAWMLRNGATCVNLTAAGTLIASGNGTAATAIRVSIASDSTGQVAVASIAAGNNNIGDVDVASIAAGTNNIGDVDIASIAPGDNNIGNVDVLTIAAGDNNIGNVDIVTMPNVTLAAGTNTNEVVGDAAHDAAVAGNPVLVGAYADDSSPASVSGAGDVVRLWAKRNGAQVIEISSSGNLVAGDAANGLDVDVTRLPASTNTLEVVGDAAHDAAAAGNPLLVGGYASAAAPTDVSGDADVVRAWMLRNGATCVNLTAAGTLIASGNGTAATALRVSLASDSTGQVAVASLPASTNTLEVVGDAAHDAAAAGNPVLQGGYASAAAPTDVSADADVVRAWMLRNGATCVNLTAAGTLIASGNGTAATAIRVSIASDSTGQVAVASLPASTNTLEVVGDVAHDAAAAGNPNIIAGTAQDMDDTAPPNRVSAEGDATRLAMCRDGVAFVHPHGPQIWSTINTGALSGATVKAAGAAGLSHYVTGMQFSIGAATASSIKLTISGGADLCGPHYLEAINGRGLSLIFNPPLKVTAATALVATTSGSTTCTLTTQGYTAAG